ncbi:LppU/SCO3897 family protein [Modestobacter roseus]|uniref:Uncharacterized protein n=1 Tax=Modestobacter roseus TaxID=1181884 RepID=A0A562IS61_9ACTN|nr:hypothetical protein [Modestobacter roseus]MQA35314.1 hypothetical protein [Modestobacter roseus]TWH73553.1 hypothetical protein JD78_02076 [Modestobacter roseus]
MSTPGPGGHQPSEQHPSPQSWGQQPPAGQPHQQAWAAGDPAAGATAPTQKTSGGKVKAIIGGLVALVVVLGAASFLLGAGDPEVGDCMQQTGPTEFDVVDCSSSDAEFRVVGTAEDMTEDAFDAASGEELCGRFQEADSALWYGLGDSGHVYCTTSL